MYHDAWYCECQIRGLPVSMQETAPIVNKIMPIPILGNHFQFNESMCTTCSNIYPVDILVVDNPASVSLGEGGKESASHIGQETSYSISGFALLFDRIDIS